MLGSSKFSIPPKSRKAYLAKKKATTDTPSWLVLARKLKNDGRNQSLNEELLSLNKKDYLSAMKYLKPKLTEEQALSAYSMSNTTFSAPEQKEGPTVSFMGIDVPDLSSSLEDIWDNTITEGLSDVWDNTITEGIGDVWEGAGNLFGGLGDTLGGFGNLIKYLPYILLAGGGFWAYKKIK